MDEKLNKSLIAFRNVIKNIDKNKLKNLVDKIDKLEPNLLTDSVVRHYDESQNQFSFFYDCSNEILDDKVLFNEEKLIENNISSMLYKSVEGKSKFNVFINGSIIDILLDLKDAGEINEALAA